MATDTVTIESQLARLGIWMSCDRTDKNPNMPDSKGMDHWKCTFRRGNTRLTAYFSMGSGHGGKEPTVNQVFDCIVSDAATVKSYDFEEFCSDLGYDPDSRTAERIYKACGHAAARLKKFLGEDLYSQLVNR